MSGYSGSSLTKKLGISTGSRVLLDGAAADFDLGESAIGATVHRRLTAAEYDVIICFCPSRARLVSRWPQLHSRTTSAGALWIAWPKKASGVPTDLSDAVVRSFVLENGRVDVKVAAIDQTWSGLKNVVRVSDRS